VGSFECCREADCEDEEGRVVEVENNIGVLDP